MDSKPYSELTDLELLKLVVWREAQNQHWDGMAAVAYSIRNRVDKPSWWGHDWRTVILKPFQYSSFNADDPNQTKWPSDDDPSWITCCETVEPIFNRVNATDITGGATNYYDTSIEFPKAWGNENEWDNTLNLHRFRFWKMKPPTSSTHDDVQDALTSD